MTRYRLDYSRPGGLGPRPPEMKVDSDAPGKSLLMVGVLASQWIQVHHCCAEGWKTWMGNLDIAAICSRIATKDNFISQSHVRWCYVYCVPVFESSFCLYIAAELMKWSQLPWKLVQKTPRPCPDGHKPRGFFRATSPFLQADIFLLGSNNRDVLGVCVVYELQGKRSHIPDIPFLKVAGSQWFFFF